MAQPVDFKPMTAAEARALRDRLHREGRRVVFTNGCFDLLHAGHVRYLEQARRLGDALIVGLNSDASVRELKGPGRPLNSEFDRAEVLSGLRAVDGVVVFDSLRATELIRELKPHLYAKGGDYTPESLERSERDALAEAGSVIRILPLLPGRSTTGLIQKVNPSLRVALWGPDYHDLVRFLLDLPRQGLSQIQLVLVIAADLSSANQQILDQKGVVTLSGAGSQGGLGEPIWGAGLQALSEHRVDLLVVAPGASSFLAEFGAELKLPALCLHHGSMPGSDPAESLSEAISQGELSAVCTLHEWGGGQQDGKVWLQAEVPIRLGDDLQSLQARLAQQGQVLLHKALAHWRREGAAARA